MWLRKKGEKKLKILIRSHSANNYNWGRGEEKKIQKNLQNKSKHKNNKCFSWVTAVRVLSLTGSHGLLHLPRMPSNAVLISGSAVEAAQILIWSYSCVFLLLMSTAIRTSAFCFGLLLRLPWRTWVCPCEGQVCRWCSCLSCRGSGSTRYLGELAARAAGNIVL